MSSKLTYIFLLILLAFAVESCTNHIRPYEPKRRTYNQDMMVRQMPEHTQDGSLWSTRTAGNRLFSDQRGGQVNDIVVVKIEETSSAEGSASTSLKKDSSFENSVEALVGLMQRLKSSDPDIDPSKLISSKQMADFVGGGSTAREGKIIATVPTMIRKEMPDGNLFIEGHRVLLVNNEEHHLYVSGVIRPHDIEKDNSIKSSLIAEAHIEITGRGDITDKNRQGWGSRAMDYIGPF